LGAGRHTDLVTLAVVAYHGTHRVGAVVVVVTGHFGIKSARIVGGIGNAVVVERTDFVDGVVPVVVVVGVPPKLS
jgi:acyl-coenzyme A synthetase/AMP-(fatty) acid ligase